MDASKQLSKKKPSTIKRKAERRNKFIRSVPKLLVLDLNGVLIRRKPYPETTYTVRPYCREFLAHFASLYRLAVWTSISRARGKEILADLFPSCTYVRHPRGGSAAPGVDEAAISESAAAAAGAGPSLRPGAEEKPLELLFAYHQDQCRVADEDDGVDPEDLIDPDIKPTFLKSLARVWGRFPIYSAANTLLLDDTPAKTSKNPSTNVIHPKPFDFHDGEGEEDEELRPGGALWRVLEARAVHEQLGGDEEEGGEDGEDKVEDGEEEEEEEETRKVARN